VRDFGTLHFFPETLYYDVKKCFRTSLKVLRSRNAFWFRNSMWMSSGLELVKSLSGWDFVTLHFSPETVLYDVKRSFKTSVKVSRSIIAFWFRNSHWMSSGLQMMKSLSGWDFVTLYFSPETLYYDVRRCCRTSLKVSHSRNAFWFRNSTWMSSGLELVKSLSGWDFVTLYFSPETLYYDVRRCCRTSVKVSRSRIAFWIRNSTWMSSGLEMVKSLSGWDFVTLYFSPETL
jgi:hypothetical protein